MMVANILFFLTILIIPENYETTNMGLNISKVKFCQLYSMETNQVLRRCYTRYTVLTNAQINRQQKEVFVYIN
jgi:hypothetical protein